MGEGGGRGETGRINNVVLVGQYSGEDPLVLFGKGVGSIALRRGGGGAGVKILVDFAGCS